MRLSILLATNRKGLLAVSRIAQACSFAAPDVEVIVRDNSGDAEKREILSHFRRDKCNIVIAEPCDGLTNFIESFRLTKGEFVFLLADDDFCFDQSIPAISALLEQAGKDPSVVGITGAYVVETPQGSSVLTYNNIDQDDVTKRVAAFLQYRGPNIMHYAPLRRESIERVFGFMNSMPAFFSFHDQIMCLLYLLNGKFVNINRLLYQYEIGPWAKTETAQRRDVDFYVAAGLDPAMNAVHWFICGFEGAVLARNAQLFPDYALAQRQFVADIWFSTMFSRFKNDTRLTYESSFAGQAHALCEKLKMSAGRLSFQDLLKELADFIALFSKDKAQSYYAFWDAVIVKNKPTDQETP